MKPSRSKLDLVHSCVVAGAGCIFVFRMVCPLLGTLCGNGIEGGPLHVTDADGPSQQFGSL